MIVVPVLRWDSRELSYSSAGVRAFHRDEFREAVPLGAHVTEVTLGLIEAGAHRKVIVGWPFLELLERVAAGAGLGITSHEVQIAMYGTAIERVEHVPATAEPPADAPTEEPPADVPTVEPTPAATSRGQRRAATVTA